MSRELELENYKTKEEIQKLADRLATLRKSPQCVLPEPKNLSADTDYDFLPQVDRKILRHKCKLMLAQINNLKIDTFQGLPDDTDLRSHVMKEELLKCLSQYRECWAFLTSQKKEIKEEFERERKVNEELKAVIAAAEMKLEETIHEKFSKSDDFKRLEAKCKKVDKVNSKCWEEMSSFLDENFPLPDQSCFDKVKTKVCLVENDAHRLRRLQDLIPLKDIVKELMTLLVDSPNDPYIVTNHQHWPPYIDLLILCDIALRHPADTNRIKLMPFHL